MKIDDAGIPTDSKPRLEAHRFGHFLLPKKCRIKGVGAVGQAEERPTRNDEDFCREHAITRCGR